MTTYATFTEDGSITASADWPFPGSVQVEKDIVNGWDGILYFADDPRRLMPLAIAKDGARQRINNKYEAALVASITMPLEKPAATTVAVETSALLAIDPDALDSIRQALDLRKAELSQQVAEANTLEDIDTIVISYPV